MFKLTAPTARSALSHVHFLSVLALACGGTNQSGPNVGGASGTTSSAGGSLQAGSWDGGKSSSGTAGVSSNDSAGALSTSAGSQSAGSGGSRDNTGGKSGGAGKSSGGRAGAGGSAAGSGNTGNTAPVPDGPLTAVGCPTDKDAVGKWVNVTPPAMNFKADETVGPISVDIDPVRPTDIYVQAQYDGLWKSTDCGYTFKKINTGKNGDAINNGRQWYTAIDPNRNRDPNTPPTLYTVLGFGELGVWKSTNGGVDWESVWGDNIFDPNGKNISSDVGADVSGVMIAGYDGPDHLIAFLHGYSGDHPENNGVFESTNGGKTWVVHSSPNFAFQAHASVAFPYDHNIWIVGHPDDDGTKIFRTTNAGKDWTQVAKLDADASVGRAWWITGDTIYVGSDFYGPLFRSNDRGQSWTELTGSKVGWVVATETKLYASEGFLDDPVSILQASRSSDTRWESDKNANGIPNNGSRANVLFDGEHYVVLFAAEKGGLWRYVEP